MAARGRRATARFPRRSGPDLGTIIVTESYQYDSAGRPARRDRTIGITGETFFFTQEYNDLGMLRKITYPITGVGTTDRTPPDMPKAEDRLTVLATENAECKMQN